MSAKIVPVLPPKTKEAIEASVKELFAALKTLGAEVDPDGFVRAWMADSSRVVLATEGGVPTGLAVMAFGRRYYDQRFTASVIFAVGPARDAVLHYLRDMAVVLGAEGFIYEAEDGDTLGGEPANVRYLGL